MFSFIFPPQPWSPLFPYTPLFRSLLGQRHPIAAAPLVGHGRPPGRARAHPRHFAPGGALDPARAGDTGRAVGRLADLQALDRKSTRLNSSHGYNSYAVFCLKKETI